MARVIGCGQARWQVSDGTSVLKTFESVSFSGR